MSADWNNMLGRVVPHGLANLDDLIPGAGAIGPRGTVLAPTTGAPPSADLWQRPLDGPSYVGIRITEPLAAPYKAAVRLAAMAIERSVEPVILSRVDASGFERFGFRVERLPADEDDAAAAEAELRKFWDLAIVIDGRELERLG